MTKQTKPKSAIETTTDSVAPTGSVVAALNTLVADHVKDNRIITVCPTSPNSSHQAKIYITTDSLVMRFIDTAIDEYEKAINNSKGVKGTC